MKDEINILLVNGNKRDQDVFAFALNDMHLNYMCRFAKNTSEALKKLKKVMPDYIFINISVNKSYSFSKLERIKGLQGLQHTEVIVYSEDESDGLHKKALECGASMCVKKNSDIAGLIGTLRTVFTQG